jgi:hypothetical protein
MAAQVLQNNVNYQLSDIQAPELLVLRNRQNFLIKYTSIIIYKTGILICSSASEQFFQPPLAALTLVILHGCVISDVVISDFTSSR